MNIPDEAVEAAAKAFYGSAWDDVMDTGPQWAMSQMQAALTAAAPFITNQPAAEYHYGERFLETGMTYHSNVTEEEARRFVDSMNEVGANMEVVRRAYTPATFGPWESVA